MAIYHVESKQLLRKFQLSHDRTLDGVLDKLHSGACRVFGFFVSLVCLCVFFWGGLWGGSARNGFLVNWLVG